MCLCKMVGYSTYHGENSPESGQEKREQNAFLGISEHFKPVESVKHINFFYRVPQQNFNPKVNG